MRAGQFCGGVVVARTTVSTAAHCLTEDVFGAPPHRVPDLRVIAGRTNLLSSEHQIGARQVQVNPDSIPPTNSGDSAVITLAEVLPQGAVVAPGPTRAGRTERTRPAPCMLCAGRPLVARTPAKGTTAARWWPADG